MKPKYYMLDAQHRLSSTSDVRVWAKWYESADRRVAESFVAGTRVSTVFLGIDHNFSNKGPALLFETMVFGGPLDGECHRWATWKEAEAGHREVCTLARYETGAG